MKASLKIFFLFASLCVMTLVHSSCIKSPYRYGLVSLKVSANHEVYFKRVGRGVSHDSLALSASKDPCAEPNPEVDFIFHGSGSGSASIYYKIENDTLVIYPSSTATPPQGNQFPVKVIQHDLNTLAYADLQKNYETLGLKYLEVKLDEKLKCK